MSDFSTLFEPPAREVREDENAKFHITVTEPTRSEKDLTVKVTTKTSLSQLKSSNFFCLRTYSEFLWLSEELASKHKDCIVPLLPPKPPVKISDHSEKTLAFSLQLYLTKIGNHPVLQIDADFQRFLEGDAIVYVKKSQSLAETGKEIVKEMLKKDVEGDSYFEDKRAFVNIHHTNMKSCSKSVIKMTKTGSALAMNTKDSATKFSQVADVTTEDKLASGLRKFSSSLEGYGDCLNYQVNSHSDIVGEIFLQCLRDIQSAEDALNNRLTMSSDYDKALKSTRNKRETYEKLKSNPQSKPEKVTKAQNDVAEAEKEESDAKDMFFNTTESLKTEFSRVDQERVTDFRDRLTEAVQNQVYYEKKILKIFEDLLPELGAISPN